MPGEILQAQKKATGPLPRQRTPEQEQKRWWTYVEGEARDSGLFNIDARLPDEWRNNVNNSMGFLDEMLRGDGPATQEYNKFGLPVEWDYRTARQGPSGQALPPSALGWTPVGRPDFGPGIGGILKGWSYNFFGRHESAAEANPSIGQFGAESRQTYQGLWQQYLQTAAEKPGWQPGDVGHAAAFLGQGIGYSVSRFFELIGDAWKLGETADLNLLTALPRALGATATAGFELFQAGVDEIEARIVGPSVLASEELVRRHDLEFLGMDIDEYRKYVPNAFGLEFFPLWATVGAALITGKINREELHAAEDQYKGQLASRIAYSIWKEPALNEQFMQRVRAGEDPRLLAMELGDPMAEMGPELLFDPILVLGSVFKGARLLNEGNRYRKILYGGVEVEELGNIFNKIRDADSAADASKYFGDAATLVQGVMKETKAGIAAEVGVRGPFRKLVTSVQYGHAELFADFARHIVGQTGGNPEIMLDVLHSMAYLADTDDVEAVKQGLAMLNNALEGLPDASRRVFFSPAGRDASVTMRDVLSNEAGVFDQKFAGQRIQGYIDDALEAAKKQEDALEAAIKAGKIGDELPEIKTAGENLAEALSKDIEKRLKQRLPTIQEQIKLNKELEKLRSEVAAGKKTEASVDNFLKRNPVAAIEPDPALKALLPAHEAMQKWLYRPAISLQNTIYFGLNPAYRVRNRFGNFAAMFVDQGAGPAFKGLLSNPLFGGAPASEAIIKKWWGGAIPESVRRGLGGPVGAFQMGENAPDWVKSIFKHTANGAKRDEQAARLHIYANVIPKEILKVLNERSVLQGLEKVFPEAADRAQFLHLMRTNGGDLDAAFDIMRSEGGVQLGRDLFWMTEKQVDKIRDLGILDAVQAVIKNEDLTPRQIDRALKEISRQWSEYGLRAGNEVPAALLDEGANSNAWIRASQNINENTGKAESILFDMNRNADRAARGTAQNEFREAIQKIKTQLNNTLSKLAGRSGGRARSKITNSLQTANDILFEQLKFVDDMEDRVLMTINEADAFTIETNRISQAANEMTTDRLLQIWTERSLGPADINPENLTPQVFKNALWDDFRIVQRRRYSDLRELQVGTYNVASDAIYNALTPMAPEIAGNLARRTATDSANIVARMMNKAVMTKNGPVVSLRQDELFDLLNVELEKALGPLAQRPQGIIPLRIDAFLKNMREGNVSVEQIMELLETDEYQKIWRAIESVGGPRSEDLVRFLMKETPEGYIGASSKFLKKYEELLKAGALSGEKPAKAQKWLDQLKQSVKSLDQLPEGVSPASMVAAGLDHDLQPVAKAIADELGTTVPELMDNLIAEARRGPSLYDIPVVGPFDEVLGPSPARWAHETAPNVKGMVNLVRRGFKENVGRIEKKMFSPEQENLWSVFRKQAGDRLDGARFVANQVAKEHADFALHNYTQRYGLDLMASYIYPYQFWYSRSFAKWMKRIAMHPELASRYLRFRGNLENQHAGLPDWWKHQINTNELLGMNSEHPLWINFEALVNPINSMLDTDFTDPDRRKMWYGAMMEDLGKMGPTPWAPYQLATALAYHFQGDDNAAAKWAGRLLPFSRPIRDVTALMDPKGLGVEIDPYVHLLGGGVEAYERGRVGRALGEMLRQGEFPESDIIEAGRTQQGEIWDAARARAINQRAPNLPMAVAPMFFGAAGKFRSENDVQIERMWNEIRALSVMRPNYSATEYSKKWIELENKYPFMDTVLLSRNAGVDRDETYARNVLDRIPPGMTNAIAERVGVNPQDISNFYDNKSDLTRMSEAERMRFMGTVIEIAGILEVPDTATKAEWNTAQVMYREMRDLGEQTFGPAVWDLVDQYYAHIDPEGPNSGRDFLKANPIVSDALDWQQIMIQNTPLLATYYTSAERIRRFYTGQMYQLAEQTLGADLWDKFEVYSRLKDMGEDKAAREFWNDNPELAGYMQLKEDHLPIIEQRVSAFERLLPEAKPPVYRGEAEPEVEAQSYNPNPREAWVMNQVASYSQGFTDYSGRRTDLIEVVSQHADNVWPDTSASAQRYYQTVRTNPKRAAEMLQGNPALEARITWEYRQVAALEESMTGNFVEATGGMPQGQQQQQGVDFRTSPSLQRLIQDYQTTGEPLPQFILDYLNQ